MKVVFPITILATVISTSHAALGLNDTATCEYHGGEPVCYSFFFRTPPFVNGGPGDDDYYVDYTFWPAELEGEDTSYAFVHGWTAMPKTIRVGRTQLVSGEVTGCYVSITDGSKQLCQSCEPCPGATFNDYQASYNVDCTNLAGGLQLQCASADVTLTQGFTYTADLLYPFENVSVLQGAEYATPVTSDVPSAAPVVSETPHGGTISESPHIGTASETPHGETISETPHDGSISESPHIGTVSEFPNAAPTGDNENQEQCTNSMLGCSTKE